MTVYRPRGVCVLCGSTGPLSNEDAITRWSIKLLGVKGSVKVMRAGRQIREARHWRVLAHQALCIPCNSEWLGGQIEPAFNRVAGAAMTGLEPLRFDREAQELIAFWTIKSALLIELAARRDRPSVPIPRSVFRWLHQHKSPPPGSAVWIGATGPQSREPARSGHFANQPLSAAAGQAQIGNMITLAIGNLLLKTLIVDVAEHLPEPSRIDAQHSPNFMQIYPIVRESVDWPPPPLTYIEIDTVAVNFWPVLPPSVAIIPTEEIPMPPDFEETARAHIPRSDCRSPRCQQAHDRMAAAVLARKRRSGDCHGGPRQSRHVYHQRHNEDSRLHC